MQGVSDQRSEKQERLARHDQRGGAAEHDRLARKVMQREVCEGRVDEGDGAGHVRAMRPHLLTLRKGPWQGVGHRRRTPTPNPSLKGGERDLLSQRRN